MDKQIVYQKNLAFVVLVSSKIYLFLNASKSMILTVIKNVTLNILEMFKNHLILDMLKVSPHPKGCGFQTL